MKVTNRNKEEFHKGLFIFSIALLVLYTASSAYLYYMQAIQDIAGIEAGNRLFESDLPYHIKMAVVDNWYYSLTGLFYKLVYMLPASEYLVAAGLSVVTGVTVWLTYQIIRELTEKIPNGIVMCISLCLNFMMAAHWDFGHTQWYIGYESGNLWHNSTYLLMRLFALLCIKYYIRLHESYRTKISVRDAVVYSFLLMLSTAAKPSFVVVFLPGMAILLLVDLIQGVAFKKVFFFAITVVPSLLVVLWQNVVLFGDSTESGIVFDPWYTLSLHAKHPKVTLVLSIAFPLIVLFFSLKELLKNRIYLISWIMWGLGFLQMLLLTETGERSNAGNFVWGYAIAIFVVNVTSLLVFIKRIHAKKVFLNTKWIGKIYYVIASLVFLYQTYCGVLFYIWMLQGKTYWI
jgi:hypothetical protein